MTLGDGRRFELPARELARSCLLLVQACYRPGGHHPPQDAMGNAIHKRFGVSLATANRYIAQAVDMVDTRREIEILQRPRPRGSARA